MAAVSNRLTVSNEQFAHAVQQLKEFVAIPSVSFPNSPDYKMEHLKRAADFATEGLREIGFEPRQVTIENSPPFIVAQRVIDRNLPTVTLYAHYDVQPVDRERWRGDPFVAEEREGRLYGRGASDDKAGIVAIWTALRVFRDAKRQLPINVNVFFEGEEEYESSHMDAFLKQEAPNMHAHALVVLDGLNRDIRTGTLNGSTRGLVDLSVRVEALRRPVHSGIGCLLPDPAQGLAQLIGALDNPRNIPGFMDDCEPLSDGERQLLRESSESAETYAGKHGVLPGATLRGAPERSVNERVLEEPSISVVNMKCGQPDGGNSIQESASCAIGIRTVPGQDPDRVGEVVKKYLLAQPLKHRLRVQIEQGEGAWAWKGNIQGPFSQAYLRGLKSGFEETAVMPIGGTLPLMRDFERHFPGIETILAGMEDPDSAAHSYNESQDLSLFRQVINSLVGFLEEARDIRLQ